MAYTEAQLASMSDEELLNLDTTTLAFNTEETAEPAATVDAPVVEEPQEDDTPIVLDDDDADLDADKTVTEEDTADKDATVPADAPEVTTDTTAEPIKAEAKATEPAKAEVKTEAVAADDEATVKAFHAKITAPFKANGRDMQVKDADEAIQLMQMGANYGKKMSALKPNLAMLKSLETAGLLSQEKIDFLIDVMAKKPEAISKLVQDSGIDPLDISAEKADGYRPTSYKVSDKSMELDSVFDELQGSEHYGRTLGVVAETLDERSKQIVADNPQVLRNLHQHIADGVFDQVWPEVERQRVFNSLNGLSDLEAYRQIGDQMASSGKLQLKTGVAPQSSQAAAPAKVVVESNPKQADDSDRRNKRQAASPTKTAVPSSKKLPADFNPLAMSDEEILKLDMSKFE